ncbi:hypothetical protein EDB92DRAFT_1952689 [Lactarius akahatsu]|uniref:Fungal-type protein kinase domain-containing protein n=1 Tax=Lactarius akahatsu TaxID=416441 RepID=A0AAD4Q6D4_9AGAM|nr:hypothetical protein EDB92DRAFT_1952689 [Lactarius akahatsu]
MSSNSIAVDTQGTVSEHQSSPRFSSATSSPAGLGGSDPIVQSEMMARILHEFSDATFFVDLTAEGAPLQADSSKVRQVLNRLRDHDNITHTTLLGNNLSTEDAPRLPKGFTVERYSYAPLTHFLNAIVHAATECLTPWTPRHLSNLRFHPYDKDMLDTIDSKKPLKPDILGLLRSSLPPQEKISWNDRDLAVIVEVKNEPLKLVKQLSTYARCFLSIDRRRSFSITIAFDQRTSKMHFIVFHRSGLSSSHELSLRSEAGFQSIVKHIVGILSIPDEEAFGLDRTRSGDVHRINNRNYEIVRPIHTRVCVRGRATAVYGIRACTPDTRVTTPTRSRQLTLPDGVTELPENMVYKFSYQTEGHSTEGDLLSGSLGQFGIVDIVGSYTCTLEDAPFGSTVHHIRNSTFWRLSDQFVERPPDNRYLHCTAMALEGLPLLYTSDVEAGIPSPAELLESILHAMIGHYNLYLGGVLHRDVSNGNILRLREPIERPHSRSASLLRPELGDDVNLSSCRGFLADLDHAIEWRKVPPTASRDRSGTLPFISLRLVNAWAANEPTLHTAADDLESFMWVLVWSLVHILKKFATITVESATINRLADAFSSFDTRTVLSKGPTLTYWRDKVFSGLIEEWSDISDDSHKFLRRFEATSSAANDMDSQKREWDRLEKYCGEVYIKFIRAGYVHLENIRGYGDWEAVIATNGEELLNR